MANIANTDTLMREQVPSCTTPDHFNSDEEPCLSEDQLRFPTAPKSSNTTPVRVENSRKQDVARRFGRTLLGKHNRSTFSRRVTKKHRRDSFASLPSCQQLGLMTEHELVLLLETRGKFAI